MLGRQRALVTPRGRAIITRRLAAEGRWNGTRRGIKITLWISEDACYNHVRHLVRWRVKIRRRWLEGSAETAFDAIAEIERKAAV